MNILKNVLVPAAFLVAASSSYAATVDLGELDNGINSYVDSVVVGSFSNTYTFSLADLSSASFSLVNAPLTNSGVSVFNISNLTYQLYDASNNWLAGAVAGGEFSFASLAAGNYSLIVSGTANGAVGGLYSGSISVAAVPEPSSVAMLMIGFAALGAVARRRKTKL